MKILIVDDNIDKTKKIIQEILKNSGIERKDISSVLCANEARNLIEKQQFELMILDLNLPLFFEDEEENIQITIDLINDMNNDTSLLKPRYIIGLSQYEEMVIQAKEIFDDNLWVLLEYDSESDVWAQGISNCIKYLLSDKNRSDINSQVDICFITALVDPELSEILKLPLDWKLTEPLDNTTFINKGVLKTEKNEFSVIALSATRMGMVSSSVLTSKIISQLKPKFIIMSGICAGIKGKVQLGDPILATTSWDYQSGKRILSDEKSDFMVSPHQIHIEEYIENRFRLMAQNSSILFEIKKNWQGNSYDNDLKLHTGSLASGSAVLADESIVKEVIRQERTLLGIEMEIYGVYYASRNTSNFKPITFAVKSVCDFADDQKNDGYQKYASYTSAQVIYRFLLDNLDDIIKI